MNKNDVKQSLKLYGLTVVATFFNLLIYFSFMSVVTLLADDKGVVPPGALAAANVTALILQAMLFVIILYGPMWKYGNHDINAVKYGRRAEDKWRGLKIGLIAAVPSILAYVVLVADKLFGFWKSCAAFYRLANVGLYPLVVWAFGPDVAASTAGVTWGGMVLAAVPILVMPTVATIAYRIGYADVLLMERLVYVHKKDEE
ncbi:MAG: hypothetical protein IJO59_05720 [Clostridia bacterium]|nr:hypothetical protein [Clostridia bacterium]